MYADDCHASQKKTELLCEVDLSAITNHSRTLGKTQNWIGCGFIDKAQVTNDHIQSRFPFYSLVYVARGAGTYIAENGNAIDLVEGSVFQRIPTKVTLR